MTRPTPSLLFTVLLASLALAPAASAQSSGSVVIVVEGSITTTPAPAPVPPVVVVEAPAAAPIVAPTPVMPPVPSVYGPPQIVTAEPAAEVALEAPTPRIRRRWGLVANGAAMAGVAWALNIGGTVLALAWPFENRGHRDALFFSSLVPVAGPMMQIAFRDGDWQIPFYVASSALQLTGFIMAFVGTFSTEEVDPTRASVIALPYATSDGAGVSIAGSF